MQVLKILAVSLPKPMKPWKSFIKSIFWLFCRQVAEKSIESRSDLVARGGGCARSLPLAGSCMT